MLLNLTFEGIMSGVWIKVLRWALFGVLVSLLPLVYSFANLHIKSQAATWTKVLGGGELLIVVWALCAAAIGELFGSSANFKISKIVSGGFTLLILIFSALMFASVAEAKVSGAKLDDASIVLTSFLLLIFATVSCGSCVALSEL